MTTRVQPMFSGKLGFLSNFDLTPFVVPELGEVKSGEHAFNAFKTTNVNERLRVLDATTPAESKRRGRRVSLRQGWDTGVRVTAMSNVLSSKFLIPELAVKLEATGDLKLIETNTWHDQFWGDCTCSKHTDVNGQNMLGELLMALRARKRGL